MINNITANELKVKGVSILEKMISPGNEAIITVRGKDKFVVLAIDDYNHLRDCELEAAIIESKQDIAEGRVKPGTVEEHIKRITNG